MDDFKLFMPEKLTGPAQYRRWAVLAKLCLENAEVLEFIETEVAEPDGTAEKKAWRKGRARTVLYLAKMIGGDVEIFCQNENLIADGNPYAMWTKIKAKFNSLTYSSKLDVLAVFHNIQLGAGGVEELINAISKSRGDCGAVDIVLEDFELKCKLLSNLPADLIDVSFQQRDKSHENDSFNTLAETVRSYEKGHRVGSGPSSSALWVAIAACTKCGRKHHLSSKCWGRLSDADYAAKLAAFRKDKKDAFKKKASTGAMVATVGSLTVDDNANDCDYYAMSCLSTARKTAFIQKTIQWVADSGAGHHMTNKKLCPTKSSKCKITCANNEVLKSSGTVGMGDMEDVLLVPGLAHDLASIGQLCDDGGQGTEVIFDSEKCRVEQDAVVVARGIRKEGLYIFPHTELVKFNSKGQPTRITNCLASTVNDVTDFERSQTLLWHQRLGHLGYSGLVDIVVNGSVTGIPEDVTSHAAQLLIKMNNCDACTKGKATRVPIRKHRHVRAKRKFELVHTDVMGPFPVNSRGGARYLVTFVDDFSGYVWVEFLERKSDVFDKVREFVVKHSTSQCKVNGVVWGCDLKYLRSDNGGEYRNHRLTRFCKTMGITQQFSEPYTPEQNGRAERMNRTLLEMVKSNLKHANLGHEFWAHTFQTAAYLRNRCLSRTANKVKTPYELLHGEKPDLSHVRVFGCVCYVYVHPEKRKKMDDNTITCRLVGYEPNGYRVWNMATNKIFVTREVVRFDEDRFEVGAEDMVPPAEFAEGWFNEWSDSSVDVPLSRSVEGPVTPDEEQSPASNGIARTPGVESEVPELVVFSDVMPSSGSDTDSVIGDVADDVVVVNDTTEGEEGVIVTVLPSTPETNAAVPRGAEVTTEHIVVPSVPVAETARVTRSKMNAYHVDTISPELFAEVLTDHKEQVEAERVQWECVCGENPGGGNRESGECNLIDPEIFPSVTDNEQDFIKNYLMSTSNNFSRCSSSRPMFEENNLGDFVPRDCGDRLGSSSVWNLSAKPKFDSRIPRSYYEARKSDQWPDWKIAIDSELASLKKHQTWKELGKNDGPENSENVVGSKWVFDLKTNKKGEILRYKARLVAQGFTQVEGIDYKETYAPVASRTTLRMVMSLAAQMDLEVEHMDVCTAFLNAGLAESEQMYMRLPPGASDSVKVVKLLRCLYGLKQSPREWNLVINAFLVSLGYKRCKLDPCLYTYKNTDSGVFSFILLYVDDLIIGSSKVDHMKTIKSSLNAEYDMKDLGPLDYCLGLAFTRDRVVRTIEISQEQYVKETLDLYDMLDCYAVSTPGDANIKLCKAQCPTSSEDLAVMAGIPYSEAVGRLLYIMCCTRPDIGYAVNQCARFMDNPGMVHWVAVKRIMRYLKGTMGKSILMGSMIANRELLGDSGYSLLKDTNCTVDMSKVLLGFSDADHAGCLDTRRSTTGYVFFFNGPISWCSKRQQTSAGSPCEAEYMGLHAAGAESRWISQLFGEISEDICQDVVIFEDNTSAIALANHDKITPRSKHIDIKYHVLQDWIHAGFLRLVHGRTRVMCADALTKNLGATLAKEHNKTMCG